MAAKKKAAKSKAAPKAPKKPSVLGNDPFARGSADRGAVSSTPSAAPERAVTKPATPEIVRPVAPVKRIPPTSPPRPVLQRIEAKPQSAPIPVPMPTPRFTVPAPAASPVKPTKRSNVVVSKPLTGPGITVRPKPIPSPPGERVRVRVNPFEPQPQAAAPSAPTISADPRPHAAAPSAEELSGPAAHRGSPTISADPRPHAGAPSAQELSGPAAHRGSPTIAADPQPHRGAPSAQELSGPAAHRSSPTIAADPQPHAAAPSAEELTGFKPHRGSPAVGVDPRPHAGAPSAEELTGPAAHRASPTIVSDPTPHAAAPSAEELTGFTPHRDSPAVGVDPRPHAGAPSAQELTGPAAHRASPTIVSDPTPHAAAPSAEELAGPAAHRGSPTISADPLPHAGAPSAEELTGPAAHRDSPTASEESARPVDSRSTLTPTLSPGGEGGLSPVVGALKGILSAVRTSIGLASRTSEVDAFGKDQQLATSLRPLGDLLYDKYWRVRVEGAELLPDGPFIIVANHAGALPLDGPVLHLALRRERPDLAEARWLLEDQIFHAPFVGVLANRLGAVRANPENATRLLGEGRPLIVFPEGFHGLSKPFSERYQLRRFGRGGYLKIALRTGVPIIPAAIVGGEESMPLIGKIPGGLLGVEYLPLTLPPLPAKWHIRFAEPVSLDGAPTDPEHDLAWIERKNLAVRDQIEGMLTHLLQNRDSVF